MNLPFDEEFDFTATLYEYKGKMIVLVGDLKVCSKLALQLIEISIPMVCILYDDIGPGTKRIFIFISSDHSM